MFEFNSKRVEEIFYDRKEDTVFKVDGVACFFEEFLEHIKKNVNKIQASQKDRENFFSEVETLIHSHCVMNYPFDETFKGSRYQIIFLKD